MIFSFIVVLSLIFTGAIMAARRQDAFYTARYHDPVLQERDQERDAWKLAATAALTRLADQDRLRADGKLPPATLWGIGGNLGTYGGDLAPGKVGNLYYDATPGGAADHLFCTTRGPDGAIQSIAYAGSPGDTDRFTATPCTTP